MTTTYILNSFSLQMVDTPCNVGFTELSLEEANNIIMTTDCISAIGHEDLANVVSNLHGTVIPMNRINVHMNVGDVAIIAQLMGGRLPEGTKTLPEGFSIKWILCEVLE